MALDPAENMLFCWNKETRGTYGLHFKTGRLRRKICNKISCRFWLTFV